jgi:hypothetical protein
MKKDNNKCFELYAFLVSSARGVIEEGVLSASLRLIDAARRVAEMCGEEDSFFLEMKEKISSSIIESYHGEEDKFISFLDEMLASLATEVRKRQDLEQQSS